jgi:hypothetical protein
MFGQLLLIAIFGRVFGESVGNGRFQTRPKVGTEPGNPNLDHTVGASLRGRPFRATRGAHGETPLHRLGRNQKS